MTTVYRDSQGRVALAAAVWVDASNPKHVETNAILLGMKLAIDMGDTYCIIVSDAKSFVHWICNKDSVLSWRVAHIVQECRGLLQTNTRARWSKIEDRLMKLFTALVDCRTLFSGYVPRYVFQFFQPYCFNFLSVFVIELWLLMLFSIRSGFSVLDSALT